MAELERIEAGVRAELQELREFLGTDTEQLRADLNEAIDRAVTAEGARDGVIAAFDSYKDRASSLADRIEAAGFFDEVEEEEPVDPEDPEQPEFPTEG